MNIKEVFLWNDPLVSSGCLPNCTRDKISLVNQYEGYKIASDSGQQTLRMRLMYEDGSYMEYEEYEVQKGCMNNLAKEFFAVLQMRSS